MNDDRIIEVVADWDGLHEPTRMGTLTARPSRGKEVFSFEYDPSWLASASRESLDPALALFTGPQYPSGGRETFGMFLDSSPDRWGRMLMRRREAVRARSDGRAERQLRESDYLLGVHDLHRMGALRFRVDGAYCDDNLDFAAPPWTSLRELEYASRQVDGRGALDDADERRWLRMLIAPGGSLGGARPKASVLDEHEHHWIAKFPSDHDDIDPGVWEAVVHDLAERSGVIVPDARLEQFSAGGHTFLTRRFDRTNHGRRVHMASALTLLSREDGDDAATGASYLELADLLIQRGARTNPDLEQLWRRIVFNICVSNTDDHLRNHAFLLSGAGFELSPAYDMNPNPEGYGLTLNISETDNAKDLGLAMDVAKYFRVDPPRADAIVRHVTDAVKDWRDVATARGIAPVAQERMQRAFQVVSP